jgi:hypothetical protein
MAITSLDSFSPTLIRSISTATMALKTHKNKISEGVKLNGESGHVLSEAVLFAVFCHICTPEWSQSSIESVMTVQQLVEHGKNAEEAFVSRVRCRLAE